MSETRKALLLPDHLEGDDAADVEFHRSQLVEEWGATVIELTEETHKRKDYASHLAVKVPYHRLVSEWKEKE